MNAHADKTEGNNRQAVANAIARKRSSGEYAFQFVDNRPKAIAQRKLQEMANLIQRKEYNTGLPNAALQTPAPQKLHNGLQRTIETTHSKEVIQCFKEANGHRIANDHTAAVKTGVNNKLLYATQERIDTSNQVLANKAMPIRLNDGAPKNGLVADQTLLTVTPDFEEQVNNRLPHEVTPQDDETHHVLLPAECEKGAIAIIGAFTKTNRSAGNNRVYNDKDHANARMGELLARSTASNGAKDTWYQDWVTLEEGVEKATNAWNLNVYARANIDAMFVSLNDADLKDEFRSNFTLNDAGTQYEANYWISPLTRSRALFERIIRKFDKKMADIETKVMKTVDTGTVGEQTELVTAADLKTQLELFFATKNYNKVAIDQAIAMVPEQAQLLQQLNEGFTANGGTYSSTARFGKDDKLQALATSVLRSIDKHVAALTARNTKSLQAGSGLNAEVNPEIGQSYGIVGGHYDFTDAGRWNWHWASVIMKTLGDNITMEAHASHRVGGETHNERWDFKMYGTAANSHQTFHDEWKGEGFGKAPITVLGVARDNPLLHQRVEERSITGLNPLQTTNARVCALLLYNFLRPLSEKTTSEKGLIEAYNGGVPDLANLPAAFVATYLQEDLLGLASAMLALKNGGGTTVDVNSHAIYLKDQIQTFYVLLMHYLGHKKKQGVFP